MKLGKDSREFIGLLNSLGVEFVVVGGHAVAFHGHPRFTGDLDFLIRPSRSNAERLLEALEQFGFAELELSADDFLRPESVVQLGRPPNRLDLLTSISGVGTEEAWASRITGELDGLPVHFLGFDALLQNKIATGRDQDLADLGKLRAIAKRR